MYFLLEKVMFLHTREWFNVSAKYLLWIAVALDVGVCHLKSQHWALGIKMILRLTAFKSYINETSIFLKGNGNEQRFDPNKLVRKQLLLWWVVACALFFCWGTSTTKCKIKLLNSSTFVILNSVLKREL
jgi:hypothetical protein